MTFNETVETVKSVKCGDLKFVVLFNAMKSLCIQVQCKAPCAKTGEIHTWKGRKWLLSRHMTKSEIVQTCFLAAKTAIIHELHETFTYKGEVVFRPHYDVDALVELSRANKIDVRESQHATN